MTNILWNNKIPTMAILLAMMATSCDQNREKKEEQLTVTELEAQVDSSGISIKDNVAYKQLVLSSNTVLLTGMDRFRLIPIYKIKPKTDRNIQFEEGTTYYDPYEGDEEGHVEAEDAFKYFMPGMDIINGYNLVNIGHYDVESGKLGYFFAKPVLVKTLYFPGVKTDSLKQLPVARNYFMVSAYDEDTNHDSLINKRDMRKFYHFDAMNTKKTALLPTGFSAIRSTYDYKNDIMYIYTRFDANKNGTPDKQEPISIFWISLTTPTIAKRII